ncbi:uncharacterized protein BX663DRAFT_25074 [Cokeromyces recurvatus]|uniref:uncharacterized protein n=1 Tax=Cokeromyces recurvatus TaxID=90255 RepID=UPI00221E8DD9|nr:uncharacterized protein BX663DRAFT_25074 [Cokeromyces recurvatus]KAI7908218.1 hypothetical protein BX663DRAFT_25074 [Cokeromyces recurvatus]
MKLDIKVETTVAKFDRTITTNSVTNNLQSHSFLRNSQEKKKIELVNNHHYQQEIVHSSRMSPTSPSHNLTSITPPPSPSPKSKLRYSQKTLINRESRSNIDILADDLIDMYEKALHQCNAAENRYKRLDLTMKSTLSLHTQTYETCIQELKEKIKQLERANHVYRNSHSLTENSSRLSSSFTDNTLSLSSSLTDNSLSLSSSLNHDPIQLNHEIKKLNEPSRDTALKEEIDILKEQIRLSEQSVQQVMAHYIRELEQERAKTKKLKQVIDKQDLLIETLESKLSSSLKGRGDEEEEEGKSSGNHYHLSQSSAVMTARKSEKLLEAQIEIQGIELEDKKNCFRF